MSKLKPALLAIGIVLLVSYISFHFIDEIKLDGYSGFILHKIFITDTTRYSENYSDKKFLSIKRGMTQSEVLKIIGEPLCKWKPVNGITALQYSESMNSGNYRLRQIYIYEDLVVDVISYYYLD